MHFGWDICDRTGGEEIVQRTAEQRNKALGLEKEFSIAFWRSYWLLVYGYVSFLSILGMRIFLARRSGYIS